MFDFSFCFQRLVLAQNRRIDQLVEKIKQQQDKLEKQSLHLQALQSKVSCTTLQCQQQYNSFNLVQRENLAATGWPLLPTDNF